LKNIILTAVVAVKKYLVLPCFVSYKETTFIHKYFFTFLLCAEHEKKSQRISWESSMIVNTCIILFSFVNRTKKKFFHFLKKSGKE